MQSAEGADLLFIYSLADRLKKTVAEVLNMTDAEKEGWVAYLLALKDAEKQAPKWQL